MVTQNPALGSSGGCFRTKPPPAPKARADRKISTFPIPKVQHTVTTEQTQHLPPSSIHATNPVPWVAILVGSGAERRVQEPPLAPLSLTVLGSCSRSLDRAAFSLPSAPRGFWQRLCHEAGSIQGCLGWDPAIPQPRGAREADGFIVPAQMCCLSLPSLALMHFFQSLLPQPTRRNLLSSPESPFPKARSAASFANPCPGACPQH